MRFGWASLTAALLLVIPVINILGMVAMTATGLWAIYRIIKGGLRLVDGRPVENPQGLL